MKLTNLNEGVTSDIVVVDVQPAYQNFHKFLTPKLVQFLNESTGDVIYFFNGEDVGINDKIPEMQEFLIENGIDEDRLDEIRFAEKGYAWLRGWMDTGVDEDTIVKTVSYMLMHNVNDSRDLTDDDYGKILGNDQSAIDDLMGNSDNIYIPEFHLDGTRWVSPQEIFRLVRTPMLVGGGMDECLAEIRLLMQALKIKFKVNNKYTY